MIHYSACPVCKGTSIKAKFSAKDFTVTHESFAVWHCSDCDLLFTQDVPDQDAIGAYYKSVNYVSHSDTQEGMINKLYHQVRKRTLVAKFKLLSIETGKHTGKILDIGCGTGAFLNAMKLAGWETTGLEPDEQAREKARELYQINALPSSELFLD